MKQLVLLSFLLLNTIESSFTQKIEWVVPPNITDVDKISIGHKQQDLSKFIVEKNKLKGVKTTNNEIIVPIEYGHVAFWVNDEYIYMHHKGADYWLDAEGYEVEGDMVNDKDSKYQLTTKNQRREKQKIKFESENPGFVYAYNPNKNGSKEDYLINPNGDTLCDFFEPNYYFITEDNYALIRKRNQMFAYDDQGNLIKEYERYTSFNKIYKEYASISVKKQNLLLDRQLKNALPEGLDYVAYSEDQDLFIWQKGDVKYLSKNNFVPINSVGYESAYFDRDTKKFLGKNADFFEIYNSELNTLSLFSFSLKNSLRDGRHHKVKKDTLSGIFDMIEEKLVLPIEFKTISKISPTLFAAYREYNKKENVHYVYIMNTQGNVVFEGKMDRIIKFGSAGFAIRLGNTHTLFDTQGKQINTFTDCSLRMTNNFAYLSPKGEDSRVMLVSDLFAGKTDSRWDHVNKPLELKSTKAKVFSAKKEGKIGFLDETGKEIFPFELDEIDGSFNSNNYLTVRKGDNWGVLQFSPD